MRAVFLSILATFFLLEGCITQKRCLSKFPPVTGVTDSIYVRDSVWVEKDTVKVPADTLVLVDSVWCDNDTVVITRIDSVGGSRTSVERRLENNLLKTSVYAEALEKEVDGLKREIRELVRERELVRVIEVVEEVPKRFIPKWVWVLIGLNGLQLLWRSRRIWSKF